jgi:hypothetical protein
MYVTKMKEHREKFTLPKLFDHPELQTNILKKEQGEK